ncbi:hypothetical protein HPQ32_17595 [Photobacterium carnosum]|uniref:hypothetical protein n=1 Tax=Photobacterium carnosum TaxID=2023717 RepID=UPI001C907ED5|nr:hypothetical protein [Photobacterium carnosum]MBY3790211.1 hypothetical protein [Photobacterium carnosum]MCD9535273.1 hypothetical protein [Photobacterium carnosum]
MQFKKSILATALLSVLTLSGCNSGSSDTVKPSVMPTKTITIIDGVLENAQICVDLNNNNKCDTSDKILPQLTNKAGKVEVSLDDAKHSLIAQIIAGKTKDSDEILPVSNSYSMITAPNQSVITPFTTLAKIDPDNFSAIAEKLGLTDEQLLSNFLGHPASRILARSITPIMTNDLTKITKQKDTITKITNFISQANDLKELENNRIIINKDGNAEAQPLIKNITDILVGKTWFMASLNNVGNQNIDVITTTFTNSDRLKFTEHEETENNTYTINKENNNIARTFDNGKNDTQKLLYISSDLIIGAMNNIDETHDLMVWSTNDLNTQQSLPVTINEFAGKTWYMLADNSDTPQAATAVLSFTFNANGSVTATDPAESNETFNAGSWSINNGVLTTTIIDKDETDTYTNTVIERSSDYMVIKETRVNDSEINYAVLFNNEARPMSILNQWKNLEVTTKVNVANHKEITELSINTTASTVKNPNADSPTITIHNGQVTYPDSIFTDGTYYVMGYKPQGINTRYIVNAYGPLTVTVTNGRVSDLDFTYAPMIKKTIL